MFFSGKIDDEPVEYLVFGQTQKKGLHLQKFGILVILSYPKKSQE